MILKEGRFLVTLTAIAAAVTHVFAGWIGSLPVLAVALALAYVYRDPEREVPAVPLGVVSPADGTVETVERRRDPYLERDALCVRLRMGPFDAYSMRSPVEGRVVQRWYSGRDAEPAGRRTKLRYGLWIQTDEQDDVVLTMVRKASWRAPRCYVQTGERVGQGQRCGIVPFGSVLEVYMPFDARGVPRPGERLHAGADLLATLTRRSAPQRPGA